MVALHPAEFAGGAEPPDGGPGWEFGGDLWPRNPRLTVDPGALAFVGLWQWCAGGGMGPTLLPDPGGVLQQAAKNLDGLTECAAQAARFPVQPYERAARRQAEGDD